MPNFDGGHHFLTVLAPVRKEHVADEGQIVSSVHALRRVLATLPTAQQNPASCASGRMSPFARNTRNHFARFVVIADVAYNGREPPNALVATVEDIDPTTPQTVDHLDRPFLLFVADFDAASGDPRELDSYLESLWQTMRQELEAIFLHCCDFENVHDAPGFAGFIRDRQIETTMPFNDYWDQTPNLPQISWFWLATLALGTVIAVSALFRFALFPIIWGSNFWMWTGSIVIGLAAALCAVYALIMWKGSRPLPTAPGSDLPNILKSLYLQRHFARFIADNQTSSDADLYRAFGSFLAEHKPEKIGDAANTQPAGVIGPAVVAGDISL